MKPVSCAQYDLMLLEAAAKGRPEEPLTPERWELVCRIARGLVTIQTLEVDERAYDLLLSQAEIKSLVGWIDVFRLVAPNNPIGLTCLTKLYNAVTEEQDEREMPANAVRLPKGIEEAFNENKASGADDQNAGANGAEDTAGDQPRAEVRPRHRVPGPKG